MSALVRDGESERVTSHWHEAPSVPRVHLPPLSILERRLGRRNRAVHVILARQSHLAELGLVGGVDRGECLPREGVDELALLVNIIHTFEHA